MARTALMPIRWALSLSILATSLDVSGAEPDRSHVNGCERFQGEAMCMSVSAANRSGVLHGNLGPGCPTNAAAGPGVEDGTELSFVFGGGKVGLLAVKLSCLLNLKDGVEAEPDVADLTVVDGLWKGTLGTDAAGPIPTREGRPVWLVVESQSNRVRIAGVPR